MSTSRRRWFDLHSWVGLKVSLFMTFILATGTLAVFAHEIDWLFNPSMRVTPQRAPTASWGRWVDAIQARHPKHQLLSISAPIDPWFAARGVLKDDTEPFRYVDVEPWRAEVQGTSSFHNVHRFLRNTHRHLMLPVRWGVPLVCSLSGLLLVSLASSMVVYKRWWRGFGRWPRRDSARRYWGDWHRLLGVWSMWFVALIALTGIWYLVEQLGGSAAPIRPTAKPSDAAATVPLTKVSGASIDRALATLATDWPDLNVRRISLPAAPGAPLLVEGQSSAWLVRDRANGAAIDLASGAIVERWRGERLNAHQRIAEAADPLHFGTWGGLPSKLVWFAFGLALTGMAVSGVYLYALRLQASLRQEALSTKRHIWRGMGAWRWLSLGLIAMSLVLAVKQFSA